ncbi:MAG: SPFH domain-containing protein [Promethearchaeota archaeon]
MLSFFIFIPLLIASLKVVSEYERLVVFRFGRYHSIKGPGVVSIIPGIDKTRKVDMRTIKYDARIIKIITKDNVRCDVDTVVYYKVIDPKKVVVSVANYTFATQSIANTVLREVLGRAELDDLLTKTHDYTIEIQKQIDTKTDPWDIKVSDVAISDVILPVEMQRVIAKQAEAEREKRARIIVAEGEYIAAQKMLDAAQIYANSSITIKLRELQTMTDIAREKNLVVITNTSDVSELGKFIALSNNKLGKVLKQNGRSRIKNIFFLIL